MLIFVKYALAFSTYALVYQYIYTTFINNLFQPDKKAIHWLLEWLYLFVGMSLVFWAAGLSDRTIYTIFIFFIFGLLAFSPFFIFYPILGIKHGLRINDFDDLIRQNVTGKVKVFLFEGKTINAFATGILKNHRNILVHKDIMAESDWFKEAIMLHELAHLKRQHLLKAYLLAALNQVLVFIIIYYANRSYLPFFSEDGKVNFLNIIITGSTIGLTQYYFPRLFQKRMEYEADLYAAQRTGPNTYKDALMRLDELTDGRVTKGAITHPILSDRIKYIEKHVSQSRQQAAQK
jgi:Zn-dependent protease with chaperone function